MPPLPTNACKECGHVNEGERVYCHNCGNKLDRSILLTEQQEHEEPPEKKLKRIKKLMKPDARPRRDWWKTAIKTLFFAAVVAALVDAALPPDNVPPMPAERPTDAPDLAKALETLTATPSGKAIPLSKDAINAYLWNTARVRPDGSWLQAVLKFERVYVELEPEVLKITVQNALQNYPLYAGIEYRLNVENQALAATPVGANIGRLQIPRELVRFLPALLDYVNPPWSSLRQERVLMDKLESVQITEEQMILFACKPGK